MCLCVHTTLSNAIRTLYSSILMASPYHHVHCTFHVSKCFSDCIFIKINLLSDNILFLSVLVWNVRKIISWTASIGFSAQAARKNIPILIDAERKREGLDDLLSMADYVVCSARFPQVSSIDLQWITRWFTFTPKSCWTLLFSSESIASAK